LPDPKPLQTALDEVVQSFVMELADILATSKMDDVVASPGEVMDASSLSQLAAELVEEAVRLQLEETAVLRQGLQVPPAGEPEGQPVPVAKPPAKPAKAKPRPEVIPTVIPPVEPKKRRKKPEPEPEPAPKDADSPRKTKLRKKSDAGRYKAARDEAKQPAAKIKKWPRCSVKGCEKSVYAPSGHRQLCYEHHLAGGGSRPAANKK